LDVIREICVIRDQKMLCKHDRILKVRYKNEEAEKQQNHEQQNPCLNGTLDLK